MGLFFYNKIGSIISIGDLPTTNIIEPIYTINGNQMIIDDMDREASDRIVLSK